VHEPLFLALETLFTVQTGSYMSLHIKFWTLMFSDRRKKAENWQSPELTKTMFMSSLGFQTPLELNLRKKPIFALENYKLFLSFGMSIFFNSRDYQLQGPRRALDAELMPTLL
jgi:hypothetical protein